MNKLWRVASGMILIMLLSQAAMAQTGGQFCVRAFEDRDANGQLDPGEPFLTNSIGATLLDSDGVVIAAALMDGSPSAAQGVICFQFLSAGQYTMLLTSPAHLATTEATFTTVVEESGTPTLVQFGAQRLNDSLSAATESGSSDGPLDELDLSNEDRDLIERIVFSTLGAIIVMVGMAFLGIVIYWFVMRNRYESIRPDIRRTTGSYPAVPSDTGAYRVIDPLDTDEWPES